MHLTIDINKFRYLTIEIENMYHSLGYDDAAPVWPGAPSIHVAPTHGWDLNVFAALDKLDESPVAIEADGVQRRGVTPTADFGHVLHEVLIAVEMIVSRVSAGGTGKET